MTRTIDADALIKTLNEKNIPVDVRVNYEIMNAPTIEPDGDTISRQDALAEFRDGRDVYDIMESIEELPSAEPKTGEWTYLHGSIGSYMTISCPFCGTTFNDVAEWEYNYCPSCGARMYKGGEDDENND